MNKNIVVIYGSPRQNGNSDKLGQAFVKGAIDAQNNISEFYIRNMNIHGCIGCENCYSDFGNCSQKDDMLLIYEKLYNSSVVVFVLPIYYQGFPSQLKAVIDRMYISENKPFLIEKAIILATYATPGVAMSKMTKKYFETLIKYHEWENAGSIFVSGLDEKNDIIGHKSLNLAYELGKSF